MLNKLQGDSPFGEVLIRRSDFYEKERKQELLDEFDNVSQLLEKIEQSGDSLDRVRRSLMNFRDIENILKKLKFSYLHEVEFFELKSFMLNLSKLYEGYSGLELYLANVEFIDAEEALNILDPDKNRVAPFYLSEQYSKELFDIRNEKNRVELLMRSETDKEVFEKLKTERLNITVKEEAAETAVKKDLSDKLRPFLPMFRKNVDAIGKLDFAIQKAMLAKTYGAVCPKITEGTDSPAVFVDMKNPEVEEALRERERSFTPLSIALKQGTTLLTGANMGGKSVAVKTVVLNICLCQMGFFAFAKSAQTPLFDGIYLISEDLQSISHGLSTFGGEIVQFNNIAQKAQQEFLLIALDEFARGTNPEEGALIVRAVSLYLNRLKSVSILTTHYDNVASDNFGIYQVAGLKDADFKRLSEKLSDGSNAAVGVDLISEYMDYRLLQVHGHVEPPRDALNICRLLGTTRDLLDAIEAEYEERA